MSDTSSPTCARFSFHPRIVQRNPRRIGSSSLGCSFQELSAVFEQYPHVLRRTVSEIDCLVVGRCYSGKNVIPQVRCGYVLDDEPVQRDRLLWVCRHWDGQRSYEIDVIEYPAGSVLKMWVQVDRRDRPDLYRFVALDREALVNLSRNEYRALFRVPYKTWEKIVELQAQVEQMLEFDDEYFLSLLFETFKLRPIPGTGSGLPILVDCRVPYARPTWWTEKHVAMIEDAAFDQLKLGRIAWGEKHVAYEDLLKPEAAALLHTEELQAAFDEFQV